MDLLYFEDFPLGEIVEYGDRLVTAEEIVEFAREFDPQPFHLDEAAARESHGRRTDRLGLAHRGAADAHELRRVSHCARPARGRRESSELDWVKPVRPGDRLRVRRTTLSARAVALAARRSASSNSCSRCSTRTREVVMTQKGVVFFCRRAAAEAAP